jgi:DNA-binding CsgD family transcriptional regulator
MDCAAPNPLVLDALALFCRNYPKTCPPPETAGGTENGEPDAVPDHVDEGAEPGEEEENVEESEQFLSKYKLAQLMGISEKIKMALSGDKEWRAILVKDANKLVSGSVIKNPRITEAEVHTLVKSGIQNDEIMRLICANKEWIKSYKIRKALIENSRTPVQNAMRYLGTMSEKDLISFAKSKNIGSVISTMAKRLLFNKKK